MEKEHDDRPAFHKMGFDDKEDFEVFKKLKKYAEEYRVYIARDKFGTNSDIHKTETYDKGRCKND